MSWRPPAKPKVLKPIDSSATLPARIIRSAQESLRPYFCLTGQSSRRALSRLPLSGQLFRGAKRWLPRARAAAAVGDAVGAGAVPGHADHQAAVVAPVGGPPVLRVGHQGVQVLHHGIEVERLELLGVVEVLAHRIRTCGECWCRIDRFSWSGHQSRLVLAPGLGVARRRGPRTGTWLRWSWLHLLRVAGQRTRAIIEYAHRSVGRSRQRGQRRLRPGMTRALREVRETRGASASAGGWMP